MQSKWPFWDDFIGFCQQLIRTPSLSGEEKDVAELYKKKMGDLHYDDVWIDHVGNVIGVKKGEKAKPSICFTAHMDHVDPGAESGWEYPPYSGVIADGYIHGRGTSDLKGPGATQVYIPMLLEYYNISHGDIYIIQVVHEETGGLGSMMLEKGILDRLDYAINGEPTSNMVKVGHRGRIELKITFKGQSVHASTPEKGVNPLYEVAVFLSGLRNLPMAADKIESSTVAPTVCYTDQKSSNVTPGACELRLDWRNIPGETEADVLSKIRQLLPHSSDIDIPEYKLQSYTGRTFTLKRVKKPFSIEPKHPLVSAVVSATRDTLNREVTISRWSCGTDCPYFMDAGIPIVGFSPAEMNYLHTSKERISIKLIQDAMESYPHIISNINKLPKCNNRS